MLKLRIAFVDYVLEPDKPGRSGLSDVVWDMATELVEQGHEPHVIASYHTTQVPDPRVAVHNFPTPPIGYRNIVGHLWMLKRAASLAARLQPDIIHAPEYLSTAVFATLGIKTPIVLTVPGNVFHRIKYGHDYEWHYLQVLKWAARLSAKRNAATIATSREMKRWWERTGSVPERTPWIPLGVDIKRFTPVTDARRQLGIADDCLVLLYVGRFSPEKGVVDFVDALSAVETALDPSQVRVVLIGRGPTETEIRQRVRARKLDSIVTIHNWVDQDQLEVWYSAADALVMPSWNEPFGKVMIEAMACGTPVIATASEGPLDHIQNAYNGFLYQPRMVDQLAQILTSIVQDPQSVRQLRPQSRGYVLQNLSWSSIVERLIKEVYAPIYAKKQAGVLTVPISEQ